MKNLQLTDISDKSDMMSLLRTINSECDRTLSQPVLQATFEREWDALNEAVSKAREEDASDMTTPPRGLHEKVDGMLELVRTLSSRSRSLSVPAVTSYGSAFAAKQVLEGLDEQVRILSAAWVAALEPLLGQGKRDARLQWLRDEFGGDYAIAKYDHAKQGSVLDVRLSKRGTVVVGIPKGDSGEILWLSLRRTDITSI